MTDTRVRITIFYPEVTRAIRMTNGAVFLDIGLNVDLYFADINTARAFIRDANEALAKLVMNQQPPKRAAQDNHEAGDAAHGDAHLGGVEAAR